MPFKKNHIPWNKGTRGIKKATSGSFKKGQIAPNKGKKLLSTTGEKHWHWKGGAPICIDCGNRTKSRYAKRCGKCSYKFRVKENHACWKGGLTADKAYYTRIRRMRKKNVGGKHTHIQWIDMKERYNYTCPCCLKKEPEILLVADHIKPIVKGGNNNIENIQPLCRSCNSKKHDKIIKKYEYRKQ